MISLTFLPSKTADILNYAVQVEAIVGAVGFVPASLGISAAQAAALTAALAAAQNSQANVDGANAAKQAATVAHQGNGGTMDVLVAALRDIANTSRASDVADEAIANIGVYRRSPSPTPVAAPGDAPEFTLESVVPHQVNVRFRTLGSSSPRARNPDAIGAQIAICNGAAMPVDGEADHALNTFVSRSPASLDSTTWPTQVRLYCRWVTTRGLTGPWSSALNVSVQI